MTYLIDWVVKVELPLLLGRESYLTVGYYWTG